RSLPEEKVWRIKMVKKRNAESHGLITHEQPKSPVAEAYRILRTNLGFTGMDNPCRLIMVSSPNPQDGKSTVIANLAVVMAQAGNKVMVVDCDLRKPAQHSIFKVDNNRGFTNCLVQKLEVAKAAHHDIVENLTLLTSGPIPPNPAELLESETTRSLWPQLLQEYDFVLIDSPPVMAVTDASILAAQADGAILVVKAGETRIDLAKEARNQLVNAGANLLGVVLNQLKVKRDDYQYYYYYAHEC
ncbi:MAG: CpsD/CapB family tyrosine-protein kinase, partial [Syntrophomonas sp.]